jgi:RHS repeat-associated protein
LIQEIPELGVLDDLSSNFYQRYKQVKYTYDLVSGNVNQVSYQAGSADQFYHKYRYDADNRVVAAYTSADGKVWDQEAKYFYYVHGPLARVELANDKVQGMDFAYTIQGWIKQVNSTGLTAAHDMGKDAGTGVNKWVGADEMGFGLTYFSGDYTSIAATTAVASQTGSGLNAASQNLYNGNIKNMVTSIKAFASPTAMAYKYDQLNRIRSAEYFTNYTAGTNTWDATGGSTDFKENFTFDHNGNIITQKRNGSAAQSGVALDDLKYYYYNAAGGIYDPSTGSTPVNATNKLAYVTDAIASGYADDIDNQATNNYTYDAIGQLKSDVQEQIATIDWTVYNKIRSVTRSAGSTKPDLEFKYDAMGQRMVKVAKPRSGGSPNTQEFWTYTYYVRDAQGNVLGVYERSLPKVGGTYTDQLKLKEQNMYGSSRIGTKNSDLLLTSKSYTFTSYNGLLLNGTAGAQTTTTVSLTSVVHKINQKVFEMSNHLGNVLVTVSDARVPINGTGGVGSYGAMVRAGMEYSAFGVVRRTIANNGNYRYGMNGQEKDTELGLGVMTAEFWEYDAKLGRRWNIDPVVKHTESLYSCLGNNPIAVIDPNGDDSIFYNQKGEEISRIKTSITDNDCFFVEHQDGNRKIKDKTYYQGLSYESLFGDRTAANKGVFTQVNAQVLSSYEYVTAQVDAYVPDNETYIGFKNGSPETQKYDFKNSKLFKSDPTEDNTKTAYMLPNGTLVNRNEAGNIYWGAAAAKVGFDLAATLVFVQAYTLLDEHSMDEICEQACIMVGHIQWQASKENLAFIARKAAATAAARKRFEEYQRNHPLNGPKY